MPFESGMMAQHGRSVYATKCRAGSTPILFSRRRHSALAARWPEICRMYAEVNELFGDIVKVTPTSKAVGDMALFLVTNNLTVEDVLDSKRELAFPESVVDLIGGPHGAAARRFSAPSASANAARSRTGARIGPGATLPPADFKAVAAELQQNPGPRARQAGSALLSDLSQGLHGVREAS